MIYISNTFEVIIKMKKQQGFTLVELLVVVTIIGILISIAVPNYMKIKAKARDAQVEAGVTHIMQALENYATNHNGLYPGVALPLVFENVDSNGVWNHADPLDPPDGSGTVYTMRGIVGGGIVRPDDPTLRYLDPWYYQPDSNPATPNPPQLPDRLLADGSLDAYPTNPFKQNIQGVTNAGVPMMNVFGIESKFHPNDQIFGFHVIDLNLSYPNFDVDAPPGAFSYPDRTADPFFGEAGFSIDQKVPRNAKNIRMDRDGDNRITPMDLQNFYAFPEGDFAYIPLDPIQTDPTANDYMQFCKGYWIIAYGSKDTARANKYGNAYPNFPRPLGDGNPNTATEYEKMVRRALCGAMSVYGTVYKDQLRVADQS